MCQDYPKIDHSEIGNAHYGYQRLTPNAPFARRDSHRSIANVHAPIANISEWIWSVIQTVNSYLKQFLWHKTRVNNTRNMCTLGPNYVTTIMGDRLLFYQMIPNKGLGLEKGFHDHKVAPRPQQGPISWPKKCQKFTQNNALSVLTRDLIAVTVVTNYSIFN